MTTMLITFNGTRENGNFMGDQLCSLKAAYLFVQNQSDVDRVILTLSPDNEMQFIWQKFIDNPKGDGSIPPAKVILDNWHPGDWNTRFEYWDKWRNERKIDNEEFTHYREIYLRIHGAQRQNIICGEEIREFAKERKTFPSHNIDDSEYAPATSHFGVVVMEAMLAARNYRFYR